MKTKTDLRAGMICIPDSTNLQNSLREVGEGRRAFKTAFNDFDNKSSKLEKVLGAVVEF